MTDQTNEPITSPTPPYTFANLDAWRNEIVAAGKMTPPIETHFNRILMDIDAEKFVAGSQTPVFRDGLAEEVKAIEALLG